MTLQLGIKGSRQCWDGIFAQRQSTHKTDLYARISSKPASWNAFRQASRKASRDFAAGPIVDSTKSNISRNRREPSPIPFQAKCFRTCQELYFSSAIYPIFSTLVLLITPRKHYTTLRENPPIDSNRIAARVNAFGRRRKNLKGVFSKIREENNWF